MEIVVQANESFRAANETRRRYVVMKGSAGSGKSADSAQHYILRLMRDRGRNLLAMRKSESTNRNSTFAELQAAISRMGVEKLWTVTTSPLEIVCANGNRILLSLIHI